MSALALLYMMVMPLLGKHYSEKGLYYGWLVIVIGLIIPFRPEWDNAIVTIPMQSGTAMPIAATVLPPASLSIPWWQVAAGIWLVGVILFLAYHIIKHYCFVKMARRWSEKITDEEVLTLFEDLKREMGITQQIEYYLCSSTGTPMMIGFLHPKILLPSTKFTKNELRFIIKHELVHHKRKDLLYKYLLLVATAVHWFNPIVYVMVKNIRELCEMSCDAEVVWSTDVDTRRHYSVTLIGVMRYRSKQQTALSTLFYGGKNGIKRRIFSIMDTSKKKAGHVIICMVIVATIGTGFAVATPTNTAEAVENSHSVYANVVEDWNTPSLHQIQEVPAATHEPMRHWRDRGPG